MPYIIEGLAVMHGTQAHMNQFDKTYLKGWSTKGTRSFLVFTCTVQFQFHYWLDITVTFNAPIYRNHKEIVREIN